MDSSSDGEPTNILPIGRVVHHSKSAANVCFTLESGHSTRASSMPLSANNRGHKRLGTFDLRWLPRFVWSDSCARMLFFSKAESLAADAQRPHLTNSPLQRSAEWPRAKSKCLQRTTRLNKKLRKFYHKASGLSEADICYRSTGKRRIPTRHRKLRNRLLWPSRRVIRSFKCLYMTASSTHTRC